jgi:hypothetical protein
MTKLMAHYPVAARAGDAARYKRIPDCRRTGRFARESIKSNINWFFKKQGKY